MQVQRQFLDITTNKVLVPLPESFVNHRVELIVLTVNDEKTQIKKRRRPHLEIAGKGTTIRLVARDYLFNDGREALP